jgi:raffinose/stachyose/melibiose transport system permease protein
MRRTISKPKKWVFLAVLGPILAIYLLNTVMPILLAFWYSFFNWTGGRHMRFVGGQNYLNLITDAQFWQAAGNNIIIVIICTVGQVGLALVVSFLLISRTLKFKEFHRTVIFFPVTVSALVIGFIWSLMYNKDYGLLNWTLKHLGLSKLILPWLDNPSYILITVSIPVVLQFIGLYMIMFMGAIQGIPKEVLECAEIDGCNDWQRSIHITLPMIFPTFIVAVMICVSGTMKIFDHILVLTNGGPGRSSMVLALYAYKISFDRMYLSYGSCIAIGILILSLIITGSVTLALGKKGQQYE